MLSPDTLNKLIAMVGGLQLHVADDRPAILDALRIYDELKAELDLVTKCDSESPSLTEPLSKD
jgi:hypothetical protein